MKRWPKRVWVAVDAETGEPVALNTDRTEALDEGNTLDECVVKAFVLQGEWPKPKRKANR